MQWRRFGRDKSYHFLQKITEVEEPQSYSTVNNLKMGSVIARRSNIFFSGLFRAEKRRIYVPSLVTVVCGRYLPAINGSQPTSFHKQVFAITFHFKTCKTISFQFLTTVEPQLSSRNVVFLINQLTAFSISSIIHHPKTVVITIW